MSDQKRWYVVNTKPNAESRAAQHLVRQGYDVYMPRLLRSRKHARKVDFVVRPLFPRYLFVRLDLACDRWHAVQSTFGVQSLVLAGEKPAEIHEAIIAEIKQREGDDGYIRMEPPALHKGSKVRLLDGVFHGSEGVFDQATDKHRVAILLRLMGREVLTLVSDDRIEAL